MQPNLQHQQQDWEKAWQSMEKPWHPVNIGRKAYNLFFKSLLNAHLTPDTSLIELGCGTASLGRMLAPNIREYTGVDYSQKAIQEAEICKSCSNMRFIEANILDLPESPQYDIVWSQGLIEHFDKPASILRKHISLCKSNGTVLISIPWKYSYIRFWHLCTRSKYTNKFWPWTEQGFHTKSSLESLVHSLDDALYASYTIFPLFPPPLGILILQISR